MDIGFDISQTGTGKAGCGYYTHAMIKAMLSIAPEHDYSLYPSFGDFYFDAKMPFSNPYRGHSTSYGPRHLTRKTASAFWNQTDLDATLGHPDVVHSNNFWTPVQLSAARLIYTLYDIGFAVNPDWTTEANRAGCFEGVFRSSVAADWVVAISDYSRAHYLKLFPHFPSNRVRVVYPCSRFDDARQQGSPPAATKPLDVGGFWLSVGTIEPRKNQRMLVKAYAQYLQAGGAPLPLVLAGGRGWLMEDFQDYLVELGISDRVILTGYVSDNELIWLYRNCYANLYPSVFEGFGLPVLEGMQFGAPTLSSNSTSMPEVAGDAATMLNPHDQHAWTQAMLELASDRDRRGRMGLAASARALTFDWNRSATAMLAIYEEATHSPKRAHLNQKGDDKNGIARAENVG
jgi:glycosyltransferase involved in cell wall biosynthesis